MPTAAERAQQNQQNEAHDNEELQSAVHRLGIRSIAPPVRVFTIKQSPGRGIGWFAAANIMRGTPLLAEKALFKVVGAPDDNVINDKRNRLSPSDQEQFDALTGSTPLSKYETNTFELYATQHHGKKTGLFLDMARLNHSCIPNAYWTWNRMLNRLTIHAIVDIPMHAEITISYQPASNYNTRIQRNTELQKHYNFDCNCEACQPQSPFGAGSDARRLGMRKLSEKIKKNEYLPGNPIPRLQDIVKLEDLHRKEGLVYPMLADMCYHVAECY